MGKLDEWRNEIIDYCVSNNLSFENLIKLNRGENKTLLMFYHNEICEDADAYIGGGSPAEMVLAIEENKGKLIFTQTENTKKYLS